MEGANTDVQVDQKKIAGLLQKTRRFMIYGVCDVIYHAERVGEGVVHDNCFM
jgi:hypothetical protein